MEAVAGGAGRSSGQGALSIAQRGRVNKDLQGRSMALVFPCPAVPAPSRAEPGGAGQRSQPGGAEFWVVVAVRLLPLPPCPCVKGRFLGRPPR